MSEDVAAGIPGTNQEQILKLVGLIECPNRDKCGGLHGRFCYGSQSSACAERWTAAMRHDLKVMMDTSGPNATARLEPTVGDAINHPPHYNMGKIEPISVIEDWQLGFCLGNAVKYIARAEHKGSKLEDLKKARWYLEREITRLESGK